MEDIPVHPHALSSGSNEHPPEELNWVLDVCDVPYTGQTVQCTTYNAITPYGVATILVYTMTADDGSCTQRVYARFPWDTTSHCIEDSLSNAMDYVKDAVTNQLKGNV